MATHRSPTVEEEAFLAMARRRGVITVALFVLFLPYAILAHEVLPGSTLLWVLPYGIAMGAVGLHTMLLRCPRCGEPFHGRYGARDVEWSSYAPNPFGHCQNMDCDLKPRGR